MKIVARGYYDVVGVDQGGLSCPEDSLSVQASKDDCDINNIVKKYLRTGELPGARQAAYLDLCALPNYQEALNTVIAAEEAFMMLPADVRREFDNDPSKVVSFLDDDRNYQKAVSMGLVTPRQPSNGIPAAGQAAPGGVPASPKEPPAGGPNNTST